MQPIPRIAAATLALPALGRTARLAVPQVAVPRPSPRSSSSPPLASVVPHSEYCGAIASYRAAGAFGYRFDCAIPRDARVAAIGACGDPGCAVAVGFKNGAASWSTGRTVQRAP